MSPNVKISPEAPPKDTQTLHVTLPTFADSLQTLISPLHYTKVNTLVNVRTYHISSHTCLLLIFHPSLSPFTFCLPLNIFQMPLVIVAWDKRWRRKWCLLRKMTLGIWFPSIIHILISLVATHHWPLLQLDVKNAFLHGDLQEEVCIWSNHIGLLLRGVWQGVLLKKNVTRVEAIT